MSLGGQKNFKQFMTSLDQQASNPTLDEKEFRRIVGRAILFRDATSAVNGQKHTIESYRANVIAYLVAYLSYRLGGQLDFLRIWERQAVPPAIATALQEWAYPIYKQIRESAGSRNVSEWAKKAGCWEAVRSLRLPNIDGLDLLKDRTAPSVRRSIPSSADSEAISTCRRLSIPDWERVMYWVTLDANGHTDAIPAIARLQNLARAGWVGSPDSEDAWVGHRVIGDWTRTVSDDAETEVLNENDSGAFGDSASEEEVPW